MRWRGLQLVWAVATMSLLGLSEAIAGQQVVGTVDQDAFIANDSDTNAPFSDLPGLLAGADESDTAFGDDTLYNYMAIRGGSGSSVSLAAKALVRFQLSQAIDANLPYFIEITTDALDGSSGNAFFSHAITDSATQLFDELTLTWNNAPAAATANRLSFNAAGVEVAQFPAPNALNTPITIPVSGSSIVTFVNGPGTYATFGFSGNGTSAFHIQQKGNVSPARLYTYTTVDSANSGNLSVGSTWVGGQPPTAGNLYRIVSGHTVTATSTAFAGEGVIVSDGTLAFAVNSLNTKRLIVDTGGSLTETTTGDFFIGDISLGLANLGTWVHNGQMTINAESGGDVGLDMNLSGTGTIDVNGTVGTQLFVTAADSFEGTVNFGGTGDEVTFNEAKGSNALWNMNSTGFNRVALNTTTLTGAGNFTFNQPGSFVHGSTTTRQQSVQNLVVNAPLTIDLSQTFVGNERRLLTNSWSGSGDISVHGTATDPTSGSTTLNEFELGSTAEPGSLGVNTYSGTITLNDYVNTEVREHTRAAAYVVNQHARLEFGHDAVQAIRSIDTGQVTVNSGGSLEVGYEVDDGLGNLLHVPMSLHLVNSDGKAGSLTLNNGANTIMQISGTGPDEFDTIVAHGNVVVDGTLTLLIDPLIPAGSFIDDPNYTASDGQTFDLITIASSALPGDFDLDGDVDGGDFLSWQRDNLSSTDLADWQTNYGATGGGGPGGTISGNFDQVTIVDPLGKLAGFVTQVTITSSAVTLTVSSAAAVVAVPEPAGCVLLGIAFTLLSLHRRS